MLSDAYHILLNDHTIQFRLLVGLGNYAVTFLALYFCGRWSDRAALKTQSPLIAAMLTGMSLMQILFDRMDTPEFIFTVTTSVCLLTFLVGFLVFVLVSGGRIIQAVSADRRGYLTIAAAMAVILIMVIIYNINHIGSNPFSRTLHWILTFIFINGSANMYALTLVWLFTRKKQQG